MFLHRRTLFIMFIVMKKNELEIRYKNTVQNFLSKARAGLNVCVCLNAPMTMMKFLKKAQVGKKKD